MAVPNLNGIIELADILTATRDETTGAVLIQCGDVVTEQATSQLAEVWQQQGLVSVPSNPTKGAAAQALNIKRSDQDLCVAIRDVRSLELGGTLRPGETCLYGPGADGSAQGRIVIKDDGTISLLTTDNNTSSGKTCSLRFGPAGLAINHPFFSFVIDEDGFWLTHKSGVSLSLGKAAGLPPPFDSIIPSFFQVIAGSAELKANRVCLGTNASLQCGLGAFDKTGKPPSATTPTSCSNSVLVSP